MPADLTTHVLTVLGHTLDLKDRLGRGDQPSLPGEQNELKRRLLADDPVRRHPEYMSDHRPPVPADCRDFLGIRYALACWADELFLGDPGCAWKLSWQPVAMEQQLYGGLHRDRRFWAQADLALSRPGPEAAEAYLWCVTLGFRGDPVGVNPREWVTQARQRVLTARQVNAQLPADRGLRTFAPPLRGPTAARAAARLAAAAGLAGLMTVAAAAGRLLR